MREQQGDLQLIGIAFVDRWIGFGVRHPRRMVLGWVAVIVAAGVGLLQLRVETSGESVLDKDHPRWAFYRESVARFGNDEVIVAAVSSDSPYAREALELVAQASESLEDVPGVRRVDSLSTLPIIDVTSDGEVRLEPALDSQGRSDGASVAERVKNDRIATRSVVSEDGRMLAINVWPEAGTEEHYDKLLDRIRGTVAAPHVAISGVPVFRTETNLRTQKELGIFVPITVAVMALLLFACFQSARGVVVPLMVSGVSVLTLFGLMGWIGIPVSAPTMILPPVLLAIGCAYTMHLLTEVESVDETAALERAIKGVARPIALSGLITSVGFASTAIVPIEAVQRVGILGSIGSLIACAATTGLGGAIVVLWRGRGKRNALLTWLRVRADHELLDRIRARSGRVILCWGAVLALGLLGATRLHVESDVVVWFPHGNAVRDAYEEIKAELSGISPLNVVVSARSGGVVTDPDVIRAIDGLSSYLGKLPEVGKVLSVVDPLREIHDGFTAAPGATLPADRAAIEQYLLLLEGTNRLGDVITRDRSAANLLLRVNDNGSRDLLRVAERAEDWWERHGPEGTHAQTTGIMYEVARAEEAIALGQIQGLGLDVMIIAGLLYLALRSVRLTLLALVPNVLPIGLMFGFMGFSRIPLDLGTVFVSNLAVGVAVDETIHLITAYARGKRAGFGAEQALSAAMRRVVPALVFTTVVIAAGFLVLSVSEFRFTRNLGLLTAGVMVLCVASNATLLPALLIRADKER